MSSDQQWDDPDLNESSRFDPDDFGLMGAFVNFVALLAILPFYPEWIPIVLGFLTASCVAGALGEGLARGGGR